MEQTKTLKHSKNKKTLKSAKKIKKTKATKKNNVYINLEGFKSLSWEPSKLMPGTYRPVKEITLLKWKAPSRPFKRKDPTYLASVLGLGFLFAAILFILANPLGAIVTILVSLFLYILYSKPPYNIEYKITTFGLYIDGEFFSWQIFKQFWFDKKYDYDLLNFLTYPVYPGQLTIIINGIDKKYIREIIGDVLLEKKPKEDFNIKVYKYFKRMLGL